MSESGKKLPPKPPLSSEATQAIVAVIVNHELRHNEGLHGYGVNDALKKAFADDKAFDPGATYKNLKRLTKTDPPMLTKQDAPPQDAKPGPSWTGIYRSTAEGRKALEEAQARRKRLAQIFGKLTGKQTEPPALS